MGSSSRGKLACLAVVVIFIGLGRALSGDMGVKPLRDLTIFMGEDDPS